MPQATARPRRATHQLHQLQQRLLRGGWRQGVGGACAVQLLQQQPQLLALLRLPLLLLQRGLQLGRSASVSCSAQQAACCCRPAPPSA
jgi:hypothetical protein